MATVDEVLQTMSDDDYLHDEIQFLIDEDLRVVAIPSRGVVLGVNGDKDVNRVNFQMPRMYNGFDMSEFKIRVNYRNANSEANYYEVTDKTLIDETIYFTWLIEELTARYSGSVGFVVRLFKEENDEIVQNFYTSYSSGKILDGLYLDDDDLTDKQKETLLELLNKEIAERKEADETEKKERIAADETEKSERIAADEAEKSERSTEIEVERKRIDQFLVNGDENSEKIWDAINGKDSGWIKSSCTTNGKAFNTANYVWYRKVNGVCYVVGSIDISGDGSLGSHPWINKSLNFVTLPEGYRPNFYISKEYIAGSVDVTAFGRIGITTDGLICLVEDYANHQEVNYTIYVSFTYPVVDTSGSGSSSGSSQGVNSEIVDARIGVDGTIYGSLGSAIREQVKKAGTSGSGGTATTQNLITFDTDVLSEGSPGEYPTISTRGNTISFDYQGIPL